MKFNRLLSWLSVAGLILVFQSAQAQELKPEKVISLSFPESSDIARITGTETYYIVSDAGALYKIDQNGQVLEKAVFDGCDLEGVAVSGKYVYVLNETAREIYVVEQSNLKKVLRTLTVPYFGPRNTAFESISVNEAGDMMYLITEKDPTVYQLSIDKNGAISGSIQIKLKGIREVSSCTRHDGKWWILSDEEKTIYVCNDEFSIEKKYTIPVYNPEGICFSGDGKILIVSDDLHKLFIFKP